MSSETDRPFFAPTTCSSMISSSTLRRRTDHDVAARRTRHRTAHSDQMLLGVDLDDFDIHHRLIFRAHVARHLLAREHAAWRLALTDRTRRAMRQRVTVRGVAHGEVPALDRALETLALGHARDVDDLAGLEHFVGLQLAADRILADILRIDAELPQPATRLDLSLGVMSGERLAHQRGALRARGDLHRGVAVGFDRL